MRNAHETSRWAEVTLASLRSRGRRDGGARRAVIELLGSQPCCLTAQELFDRLRADGRRVGIATVYRALEQLTRDGFVQKVEVGDGTSRFEPIHPDGHHHHLVCDGCGKVEAFEDAALERALHRVERNTGYSVAAHEVVLHGRCERCAA